MVRVRCWSSGDAGGGGVRLTHARLARPVHHRLRHHRVGGALGLDQQRLEGGAASEGPQRRGRAGAGSRCGPRRWSSGDAAESGWGGRSVDACADFGSSRRGPREPNGGVVGRWRRRAVGRRWGCRSSDDPCGAHRGGAASGAGAGAWEQRRSPPGAGSLPARGSAEVCLILILTLILTPGLACAASGAAATQAEDESGASRLDRKVARDPEAQGTVWRLGSASNSTLSRSPACGCGGILRHAWPQRRHRLGRDEPTRQPRRRDW